MEAILTAILIVSILVVYASFSWGFVAFKFYGWFILPVFPDLPHYSVIQFIGFLFFIGVFTSKGGSTQIKKELRDETSEWTMTILSPWISLILGWLMYSVFF